MPTKQNLVCKIFLPTLLAAVLSFSPTAKAQTLTVIHNFNGATDDGGTPQRAGLLALGGSYYGVTVFGGTAAMGIVYQLTPQTGGTWEFSVVHSFTGSDGSYPIGSLVADSAGNIYGTTTSGGAQNSGVAYQLTKTSNGWQQNILWTFGATFDGVSPYAGLTFDKAGNLYGTTVIGGGLNDGTVFEISPSSNGGWSEQVLYNFGEAAGDGFNPMAAVILDSKGNLFGTTSGGGLNTCAGFLGCGIVFEVSPSASGWTENIIHNFGPRTKDGFYTQSPLLMDKVGNLYGTTEFGGGSGQCEGGLSSHSCGVVFQLSPSSDGTWAETILHSFVGGNSGAEPDSGLVFDRGGNLYGETAANGNGTVYRLTPTTSGAWKLRILASFNGTDGIDPQGGLIIGTGENLLGTTNQGGAEGLGAIFEITP